MGIIAVINKDILYSAECNFHKLFSIKMFMDEKYYSELPYFMRLQYMTLNNEKFKELFEISLDVITDNYLNNKKHFIFVDHNGFKNKELVKSINNGTRLYPFFIFQNQSDIKHNWENIRKNITNNIKLDNSLSIIYRKKMIKHN